MVKLKNRHKVDKAEYYASTDMPSFSPGPAALFIRTICSELSIKLQEHEIHRTCGDICT